MDVVIVDQLAMLQDSHTDQGWAEYQVGPDTEYCNYPAG